MAAYCPNCKSKLSCGCQMKTAKDGKKVCKNCISSYEAGIKSKTTSTKNQPQSIEATYSGPGEQIKNTF